MFRFKFCQKVVIVGNNSIVNNSDSLLVIEVRMSIDVSLVSVSGPPGVTNAYLVIVTRHSLHEHALDAIAAKSVRGGKLGQDKFRVPFLILRD